MKNKKKILLTYGTRPEAIKMAPLYHELKKDNSFIVETCVTAQHRSMLDNVLNVFDIIPDHDLNLMKENQQLVNLTSEILTNLSSVLKKFVPDLVLVHGDTTTAMASALAAFYEGIKIGHIEAGLRTYQIHSPYPEELNRQIISRMTDLHFAPTEICKENIINERPNNSIVEITGNTVIDALFMAKDKIENDKKINSKIKENLNKVINTKLDDTKYVLITGHRRENFGNSFINICESIKTLANNYEDVHFIYPVHLNPNVQKPVYDILDDLSNVHLIEPQGYLEFVYLMTKCHFILTDSGGIQEEAPSLMKPVLVMRDTTERPEAIQSGGVKLVGSQKDEIIRESMKLLDSEKEYSSMCINHNPYGDGNASYRIGQIIKKNI